MKKLFFVGILSFTVILVFLILPKKLPNIILISIDTLRADHVGIYGYNKTTTPTMDAIAREGIFFENAVTAAPWTLPSHMSMLTGLPPLLHGVEEKFDKLSEDITLLAQVLQAKGYATKGIVTLPFVKGSFGFSRGFAEYDLYWNKKADKVVDLAITDLKKRGKQPYFLFLHFCDPHWPYSPPEKYAAMFGINTKKKKMAEARSIFLFKEVRFT